MPTLDSDDVAAALKSKMKAEIKNKHDIYYNVYDVDGSKLCFTRISHGSKETLRTRRVAKMASQLRLDDSESLVNLVKCTLSKEDALEQMRKNPRDAPYMAH
jgi:hypothetical protein